MSRIARIAAIPLECWMEIWRWIGAQGGEGATDEALRAVVRGIWAVLSIVLFPMLVMTILLGV